MQIHGFHKLTLLDYPGNLAATIFLGGCNMRCPFCHNASLVINPSSQPAIPAEEVIDNLRRRIGVLEGVCITGGEPTLYPDLPEFIQKIKSMNFKVKLDTNGTNPDMIKALLRENMIDYVAMDIKNSQEKYSLTTGTQQPQLQLLDETIHYLITSTYDYEFRTTIVKELHSKEDILSIAHWIQGAKAYYLQSYRDSGDIITPGYHSHSKDTLLEYAAIISPYIHNVSLRGID